MSEETYYEKILSKHFRNFITKYEKVEDKDFEAMELDAKKLFPNVMIEVINDLDQRIRRLEKKCQKS